MVQKLIWSEAALNQKISTYAYWTERNGSTKYAQQIEILYFWDVRRDPDDIHIP